MNLNINLEKLQQQCRICLNKGDINIWNYKVPLKQQDDKNESNCCVNNFIEKSIFEIMDIFLNSQDLLNLTEEFPLLCWQCLEDLKLCYMLYKKIKLANVQLKTLYQESLNQCFEEEHLIEVLDENELNELKDANRKETLEEIKILNLPHYEFNQTNELKTLKKSVPSKQITLDKNDSFIVTQFIPVTLEPTEKYISDQNKDNDEGPFLPPQQLLTVNLKAVEVTDLKNLASMELSQTLSTDLTQPAIYICQYCPQAFAKSDYLKTHIHKSHVCKFCTQPFNVTEDLFRHIREAHTENKCAICHKMLSSRTNLRHHIKRVHRIKLPAKVTLIDFIKSTSLEENMEEAEVEILQEELEAADIHLNAQYEWTNDDCIEMFNEQKSQIN